MLVRFIYEQYGLNCEQSGNDRELILTQGNNQIYLIPLAHFYHQDIASLAHLANDLYQQGDMTIGLMVPDRRGEYVTTFQGESVVLLMAQGGGDRGHRETAVGLAEFHTRGERVVSEANARTPYVHATEYWIERMDGLKGNVKQCLEKKELTPFENRFLEVFPYFSGMAENAIQYMVDLKIDSTKTELSAICHYRFSDRTWHQDGKGIKNPADWVIDHPSRDLAEWLRRAAWKSDHTSFQQQDDFLQKYHRERPLTQLTKALIYGRLLFPIPFIEISETYFASDVENDNKRVMLDWQLERCITKIEGYETFLRSASASTFSDIKTVEWL